MAQLEFEITASIQTVTIGGVTVTNAEVYNGNMKAPTLRAEVGDDLVVRFINDLPYVSGIHWHGIELSNSMDGTPVTQAGVKVGPFTKPVPASPSGGTYLYKFKVTRPGIFWYHPHHFHSTNRVFRGLYGMLIVTDTARENLLRAALTIPATVDTHDLVLGDTTICKLVNDTVTYPDPASIVPPENAPEWVSGATTFQDAPAGPQDICVTAPLDDHGVVDVTNPFGAGEIPNIQKDAGKIWEGQTVLANGDTPEHRFGTPTLPVALAPTASMLDVAPGQGIRLQAVNCSTSRYFRLKLTYGNGTVPGGTVELIRIGGEGGLLNAAVMEGGTIGTFDTGYDPGEILLPPATRADFVFTVPADAVGVMTMWTRDYKHKAQGSGHSFLPTVPVKHFNVSLPPVATPYSITNGTPLLDAVGGSTVQITAAAATDTLLNPLATGSGGDFLVAKDGSPLMDIQMTGGPAAGGPSIDSIPAWASPTTPYTSTPKLLSSRYAETDNTIELTVTNATGTNHPFHLHGFSFQPIELTRPGSPTLTWAYPEYRDTVDVPGNYTLKLRFRTDDRTLADGVTLGGALGRWLFHCHIFYHAHRGMLSELVITDAVGREKPNIDVGGSWSYAPSGGIASRKGTYFLPDGDTLDSVVAHLDNGTLIGDITITSPTTWEWQSHTPPAPPLGDGVNYVYVTITGNSGYKDQTVFRLQIGGMDEGSDNGDPHIRTIDGTNYDFQAVGEFTLLADRDGMVIQTRQTPVPTAKPVTNSYTGLTSCVSVNTAVAALLGSHYVSYQLGQEVGSLEFFVNGKRFDLTTRTLNLDNNLVRGVEIDGKLSLRVDFEHHAVLIATPRFWTSNNIHYFNISVSHTHGDEGLMGKIPEGSWLPKLRSGATLGPKPKDLHERYVQLYQTFADSWRVSDKTSLFTYASGKSTVDFTDKDWPPFQPPCKLKPQFEIPGTIVLPAIPEDEAKIICQGVTENDLFANCVLDVSATGDETFADGYLIEQRIRLSATSVQVVTVQDEGKVNVTAIVLPLNKNGKKPTGKVTFTVNGVEVGPAVAVDVNGHASIILDNPKEGDSVGASYADGDEDGLSSSSSPTITLPSIDEKQPKPDRVDKSWPRYFWLILIIILLFILVLLFVLIR